MWHDEGETSPSSPSTTKPKAGGRGMGGKKWVQELLGEVEVEDVVLLLAAGLLAIMVFIRSQRQ